MAHRSRRLDGAGVAARTHGVESAGAPASRLQGHVAGILERARRAAAAGAGSTRRSTLLVVAVALLAVSALPTILGARGTSVSALDALPAGPAASPAAASPAAASPAAASPAASIGTAGAGVASSPATTIANPLPSTVPAHLNAPTDAGVPQLAAPVGFDPLDLATKALLVGALLYLTLRALRHLQSGPTSGGSRLALLESRTLGSKATLHLVGVGERRIIVGLTPAGMVAIAELDATELPDAEPRRLASTGATIGSRSPQALLDGLRSFLP